MTNAGCVEQVDTLRYDETAGVKPPHPACRPPSPPISGEKGLVVCCNPMPRCNLQDQLELSSHDRVEFSSPENSGLRTRMSSEDSGIGRKDNRNPSTSISRIRYSRCASRGWKAPGSPVPNSGNRPDPR